MTQVKLTTNFGDIVLELNAEKAPITVANFVEYVKAGHYENTVFHRVIGNFMIQGGGFEPGMKEKKDKRPSIQNEADNGLSNDKYTVAMARTMEPHSASAQFFINVADNSFLNHTAPSQQGWNARCSPDCPSSRSRERPPAWRFPCSRACCGGVIQVTRRRAPCRWSTSG